MRKHMGWLRAGIGIGAISITAMPVTAQTAPQGQASAPVAPDQDEERSRTVDIIVTAERRQSRLLETPAAVAALSTDTIERQAIDGFEDLQTVTPSLTFGKFSSYGIASLRGIGTDFGTISAEPAVAIFQDGVYLGPSSAQNVPAFDLERIEVLRGPQGTLYGRNSTGGAINFITRRPSFKPEVNGNFTLGNYGTGSAALGITGPVAGNTVAFRASGRLQARDGYRIDDFTGRDADDLNSQSYMVSLLIQPSSAFSLILRGDYSNIETSLPYQRIADSLGFNTLFGGSFTPNAGKTRHFRNNTSPSSRMETWGVSGTAELTLGGVTIRSITAYRENAVDTLEDWDGSDTDIANVEIADRFTQFTQEVNVFGTLAGDVDWLIGGFYYDATGDSVFYSNGLIYSLLGFSSLDFVGAQKSSSIAGFGQVTARLTDRFNITAGLRYTRDKKSMDQSVLIDGTVDTCGRTTADDWDAWTGTLSADYHVTDDAIIYARASRGYKAGGINLGECADLFDPERLDSVEVGLRGTVLDGALSGALTAFYYDYKGIQFTTFTQTQATIDNVGGGKVKGIELEFNAVPAQGFRIDGSLSYLDTEYKDQLVQDPFLTGPYQIGGNPLIRAPKWRGNLGVEYRIDTGGDSSVTLRGETTFSAHYYHDIFAGKAALQSATREPSYTISSLRLIWQPNDRLELQAFVENIEDKQYAYRRFVSSAFGGITGQFSPPRTFGVRGSVKLGR